MTSVKDQLYKLCLAQVSDRMTTVQQAIRQAQASSNDETKSSAGDKYETGRAMAQLEIEKNGEQLADVIKLKKKLDSLIARYPTDTIQDGSLVMTDQGNFFLTIPAGPWVIDHKTYFAISVDSPIGSKLVGLKAGCSFLFRDKTYKIDKIQ
jgi:hypothetical protein